MENDNIIIEKGYEVLERELGAAGTVVFLKQFENGSGDYTKEKEIILEENTIDEIVERINKRKNIINKEIYN